jgi:outer membrane immunogenic protein
MVGTAFVKKSLRVLGLSALALFVNSGEGSAQQPFSWTGFYVGAHGGFNWTTTEFPGQNPYVAPPAPCGNCGSPRQGLSGGIVGGQIGANYQAGLLVVGVEADISKANLNGSVRDGNYIVQTDTIDLTASVRGRVGLGLGNFLPYFTAGMMWEQGTRGQSCPGDPAAVVAGHCKTQGPYNLTQSQWHQGFVYGGGLEVGLTRNISIKVEALRMRPAEVSYVLAPSATGAVANRTTIEYETTTTRVGLNYRF